MSFLVGNRAALFYGATALAVSVITVITVMARTSIAATASATARLQVVSSIISLTAEESSAQSKDKKACENRFLSIYRGQNDGSALNSQTSAQCTNVYQIRAQEGSLIVLP